jgi:hypothetical protein
VSEANWAGQYLMENKPDKRHNRKVLERRFLSVSNSLHFKIKPKVGLLTESEN